MTAAVLPHRFATDALPATFSAATRMEFVRDGYAQLAMAIDLEPLATDAEQLAYAVRNAAACNVIAERWRARDGS